MNEPWWLGVLLREITEKAKIRAHLNSLIFSVDQGDWKKMPRAIRIQFFSSRNIRM